VTRFQTQMSSIRWGRFALVLLAPLLIAGCGYNTIPTKNINAQTKWSEVQNQYQRRADLIPNLVKTVEGAANFEKSTLTEVIQARQQVTNLQVDPNASPQDPETLKRFQQSQEALSGALSRLLVVVERYPDLKANANFRDLQAQLEGTENRISVERGRFNGAVQSYNTSIEQMPTRLYAGLFGFHPRPYFAAKAGAETPPPVNFEFGKPALAH